ncbi:hypothetical protein [Inquilinus sp. CAU 1745]|uniref:hypothetical protein n=1 Tax=Inquilinus sp. CAU 1745 TaxID=3140369 RepID=UPI00325B0460
MRRRPTLVLLLALLAPPTPAGAQVLDQADRAAFQSILETRPTGVPATLPSSGRTMTVTRTETAPRICRDYTIDEGSGGAVAVEGTACRLGADHWEIVGVLSAAMTEAPSFPIPPPKPDQGLNFPLPAEKPATP